MAIRSQGPRKPKVGGKRYLPKRKVCAFCAGKAATIDYKDQAALSRYISDRAKIDPRQRTGTCAKHQRVLTVALKRARHLALLPFTPEHIRKSGGIGIRGRVQ